MFEFRGDLRIFEYCAVGGYCAFDRGKAAKLAIITEGNSIIGVSYNQPVSSGRGKSAVGRDLVARL